jgi:hypothetical protein
MDCLPAAFLQRYRPIPFVAPSGFFRCHVGQDVLTASTAKVVSTGLYHQRNEKHPLSGRVRCERPSADAAIRIADFHPVHRQMFHRKSQMLGPAASSGRRPASQRRAFFSFSPTKHSISLQKQQCQAAKKGCCLGTSREEPTDSQAALIIAPLVPSTRTIAEGVEQGGDSCVILKLLGSLGPSIA